MTTILAVTSLVGIGIPFVVDLLTKSHAPRFLKSFLCLVLSTLDGVITTTQTTDGANWKTYFLAVLFAELTALGTHYTGASDPMQRSTANIGIGSGSTGVVEQRSTREG